MCLYHLFKRWDDFTRMFHMILTYHIIILCIQIESLKFALVFEQVMGLYCAPL